MTGLTSSRAAAGKAAWRYRLLTGLFLLAAAPAHAEDLLDYVIQAIDPTLQPARPVIECLAGGGTAEYCTWQVAQQQAGGALPIGPKDDRVQLAAKVFKAAADEKWLEVLNVGGVLVAKSVSCAMLPVQGPLKAPACNVVGWVISNNAATLDKAWEAMTGPDWWALVDLLGAAACELIPAEGSAAYAKDVLCGPLAIVLAQVKEWANAVGNAAVAGFDAVENLVFGDDSHMPYDTYYALYWRPWYHYSTAQIWQGQGLGPAVESVQDRCVDYFDSHNQYRSTARKTCRNMKSKFDREVKGFADALPVAVDGYFATVAEPAIRAFARNAFGKPAQKKPQGEDLFVSNCAFQIRARFPFPEPDELACDLLAARAKAQPPGGLVNLSALFQAQADTCYSHVKQQTLDPTVWQMACDEMRARYGQRFAGETLKVMKIVGDLKGEGCKLIDPEQAGKLLLECATPGARAKCMEALIPDGRKYCTMPPLKMSDTRGAEQSVSAGAQAQAAAAAAAAAQAQQPGRAAQPGAAQRQPADAQATSFPPSHQAQMTEGQALRAPEAFEAERLLSSGKFLIRGGQAVAQDMSGFGRGWTGDAQLFWTGGAVGATLDLLVDVPVDGSWTVEIALTQAPDYGQLAFEVDQHPVTQTFDGYAPRVAGPVKVSLGTFAMQKGARMVSLKIIGRNPAASGWLAGVDHVVLRPADGRQ